MAERGKGLLVFKRPSLSHGPTDVYMCIIKALSCSTGKLMKEQGLRTAS